MSDTTPSTTYCDFVKDLPEDNLHKQYHDHEYGFKLADDHALFERLVLEINQAGLSWDIILKKRKSLQAAYDNFDIQTIANYTEKDIERLLNDAGVIRNKLKIHATIHNANQIIALQSEFGSFKTWLDLHKGKTKSEWIKLFKKQFKFTGNEITHEFLMSTGYLCGAHRENCPIFEKVRAFNESVW